MDTTTPLLDTLADAVPGGTWNSSDWAVANILGTYGVSGGSEAVLKIGDPLLLTYYFGSSTITYTLSNGCYSTVNLIDAYILDHFGGGGSGKGLSGGGHSSRIAESATGNGNPTGDLTMGYTLYPNPTSGLVNIMQSTPVNGRQDVKVLNLLGQVMYGNSITFTGGLAQLDLSWLVNGSYIIQLSTDQSPDARIKFVIMR